jgi:hypothetical protein
MNPEQENRQAQNSAADRPAPEAPRSQGLSTWLETQAVGISAEVNSPLRRVYQVMLEQFGLPFTESLEAAAIVLCSSAKECFKLLESGKAVLHIGSGRHDRPLIAALSNPSAKGRYVFVEERRADFWCAFLRAWAS